MDNNPLCEAFHGRYVLESFADMRRLLDRHRPLFAGVCLDSGAYSVMQRGIQVDLGAYVAFCQEHGRAYDFIASLDVIGGTVGDNLRNWSHMRDAGVDAMPTLHSGEPWALLDAYTSTSPRVGLGMLRPDGNMPPRAEVRAFLDECFARIPAATKVHGWGMTNYCDYPFDSVDSTTWLWEMKALLATKGQGAEPIQCLTPREIVDLVQKKYERYGKRTAWGELFGEGE